MEKLEHFKESFINEAESLILTFDENLLELENNPVNKEFISFNLKSYSHEYTK